MGKRGPQPDLDHGRIVEAAFEAARSGVSLQDVASVVGCSRERVRQILKDRNVFEAYQELVDATREAAVAAVRDVATGRGSRC